MSSCRSCSAEILWARWADSDKNVPIDPEPDQGGNVVIVRYTEGQRGEQVPVIQSVSKAVGESGARHYVHFKTCPQASDHRKPREQQRPTIKCPQCGLEFVAPKGEVQR